eukprot:m.145398 g.145398  ORF g.145398 m.145398 type:complete len:1078 (+) comp14945_c1_seq1:142-3375(+)
MAFDPNNPFGSPDANPFGAPPDPFGAPPQAAAPAPFDPFAAPSATAPAATPAVTDPFAAPPAAAPTKPGPPKKKKDKGPGVAPDPSIYEANDEGFPDEDDIEIMSRDDAVAKLKEENALNGGFIIRKSGSEPGNFVVSCTHEGQFYHFVLKKEARGLVYAERVHGQNLREAILSLRCKIPVATPEKKKFWLSTRHGPKIQYVPKKGTKAWKQQEKQRKEAEKQAKKQEKEAKKAMKKSPKKGTAPSNGSEDFDEPQFRKPPPPPSGGADTPANAPDNSNTFDPFGSTPGSPPPTSDPFGAPSAPPTSDPFGAPAAADPFGGPPATTNDPFGAPASAPPPSNDPFGAPAPVSSNDPFGAPAPSDPFGAPAPAPTSDPFGGPPVVEADPVRLALDASQMATYESTWNGLTSGQSQITPDKAVSFFQQSGLETKVLSAIWDIADVSENMGLSKSEFFTACKLIALKQAGMEPVLGNLKTVTAVPTFTHEGRLGLQPTQIDAYEQFWAAASEGQASLTSQTGVTFFLKSNLSPAVLKDVWDVVDKQEPLGELSKGEFFSACKLIALLQQNMATSAVTANIKSPCGLPTFGQQEDVPQIGKDLMLTALDLRRYDELWAEAAAGNDRLGAGGAVKFLGTSGLQQSDLKTIWDISDSEQPKGSLNKDEFFRACKLVAVGQSGGPIEKESFKSRTPLPRLGATPDKQPDPLPTSTPAPAATQPAVTEAKPIVHSRLALDAPSLEWYESLWSEAPTDGTYLPAGAAVKFLTSSKLPQADLKEVWGHSDKDAPKGKLSKEEFFTACKLVALRQNGSEISPSKLGDPCKVPQLGARTAPDIAIPSLTAPAPAPAAETVQAVAPAQEDLPLIAKTLGLSGADLKQYQQQWSEAPKEAGFLPAKSAVKYLGTSGLPQGDLKIVWDKADKDAPKGKLSEDEFYLALKLVALKQSGESLDNVSKPTPLPKIGTIDPSAAPPAASTSAPTPELPAIAKTLGLSADDVTAYETLWTKAATVDGFLPGGAAIKVLGASGLPQADLKTIWDVSASNGKLSHDDFFKACKFIALKQNGKDITEANLGTTGIPLPKFN